MKSHVLVLLVTACVGVALASELPPVVGSFSPWSGRIGTPVTISGANFSPNPEENIVYFGGVRAVVTAATANSLVVTAPAEATYQPITVTRSGLTGASRTAFVITFVGSDEPMLEQYGGTIGSGFSAMGDLDGDGKLDLAVTAQFAIPPCVPTETAEALLPITDESSTVVAYGTVKVVYAPAGRDEAVVTVEIRPQTRA